MLVSPNDPTNLTPTSNPNSTPIVKISTTPPLILHAATLRRIGSEAASPDLDFHEVPQDPNESSVVRAWFSEGKMFVL